MGQRSRAALCVAVWAALQGDARASTNAPRGSWQFSHDRAGNLTGVIDTSQDVNHCGQLDARCPDVQGGVRACRDSTCGAIIGGGFVDVWTDPSRCGGSLTACPVPANGVATCDRGACAVICDPGYAQNGLACVDLLADPSNCGWRDHVCSEVNATCMSGRCVSPEVPIVNTVNGVQAPGVAYRSSLWTGIRIEGEYLDNVTEIWLEDWGPDSIGTDISAPVPLMAGSVVPAFFRVSPTQLVIPQATLEFISGQLISATHRWYRVSLSYLDASGVGQQVMADVSVSLDDDVPVDLPAPMIRDVSVLKYAFAPDYFGYDYATGFVPLASGYQGCANLPAEPPIAVIAYGDPLQTLYPVREVTPSGVYIQAGIPVAVEHVVVEYETKEFLLVYPYADDVGISLDGAGLVLRGWNLYGDATAMLSNPVGHPVPGNLGAPVFLGDRVVLRPEHIYWDGVTDPQWYPNQIRDIPITGVETASAFVEVVSPRGSGATPFPLDWLGAPMIDAIDPAVAVAYDTVITLTGKLFTHLTDVSFGWGPVSERLTRVAAAPPGPEQYVVIDENHIQLMLSSTGGPVPRQLGSICGPGGFADAFPGSRTFTVANALGSSSAAINALDPATTPTQPPPCPAGATPGGAISGGGTPPPSAPVQTWTPVVPGPKPGGCTNTVCP